jgi:uncharacterized protein (DUF427 family)
MVVKAGGPGLDAASGTMLSSAGAEDRTGAAARPGSRAGPAGRRLAPMEDLMTPTDVVAPDPRRHELENSPRWVRVRFAGQFVADSRRALLLREPGRIPVYYFPRADVRVEALAPARHTEPCAREGGAACWSVRVGDRTAEHAAWGYPDPPPGRPLLRDHVTFEWADMDAWFEEDDEVYVHARDP